MQSELEDRIMAALTHVMDPELQIDIVNLGLINQIEIETNGDLKIHMTLTTMGCPLTGVLEEMIVNALQAIPEIRVVEIILEWEPAWTVDRMSRYAKMLLGL